MTALPPLLFYCQHSVGIGHLARSLALTRALAARFDVTLVSGGAMPRGMAAADYVRWVQLPAVGLDDRGELVSRDEDMTLEQALGERARILLEACRIVRPRAIVVELFPFGRRKFRAELEPVLEQERTGGPSRALVFCSLRDILVSRQERQRDHDTRAARMLDRYFDGVLVHSDPSFARLEESFHPEVATSVPIRYTGFVHDAANAGPERMTRPGSIIVSAGGGLVGEPLLKTAIAAHARLPRETRRRLAVVTGPFLSDRAWRRLEARAARLDDVDLIRSVPNLAAELGDAGASISQCGYNTAMDILHAGLPALVVPYGDADEDEQLKRARRLEALGALRVLPPADLTVERLADEMSRLLEFRPSPVRLNLNGAAETARLLDEACRAGGLDGSERVAVQGGLA